MDIVRFDQIDLRLLFGQPRGSQPVKINCPMHLLRLGVEDDKASMAVYDGNVHCFGCGYHLRRRGASLVFLLGEWDGLGDEDGEGCLDAVRRVKSRLHEWKSGEMGQQAKARWTPPPPSEFEVLAFHHYLLRYRQNRLHDELIDRRGYSLETVKRYRLGHTGTHFTIPIPDLSDGYSTIRYRADETVTDVEGDDFRKYQGIYGRNEPVLYPLSAMPDMPEDASAIVLDELWIVEGEYDAISGNQAGHPTLTMTNGANTISRIVEMIKCELPWISVRRWVLATDQDPAGEKAASELARELSLSGQVWTRARWDGAKDLTEYYSNKGKEVYYERVS